MTFHSAADRQMTRLRVTRSPPQPLSVPVSGGGWGGGGGGHSPGLGIVAKFDPKVSRRRTTKDLGVLVIILVALILLPHSMYVVLVLILLFFIGKRKMIC